MNKLWLGPAIILVLVAAACSGDDGPGSTGELDVGSGGSDDTGEPDASREPEDPADADDATASDETDEEEPGSAGGAGDPEESEPAEELFASFRGVTEQTVKVGVAVPDFDALQAAGISNYQGDADIAFQAFFDEINDEGGIHGRMIDPVYVPFDWTDPVTQDQACSRLAEDHEVFIVLYGLLGESNLCLTNLHQTMVMTRSFQTTALRERAETLWLQLNAVDDERSRIMAEALVQSGRLDGRTIGVLARGTEAESIEGEVVKQVLEEAGLDVTLLSGSGVDGGDAIARDNELRLQAEQFETAGVDLVFDLRGGGDTVGVFASAGFTPQFVFKALGAGIDGASDRTLLDGALSVSEINEQAMFADDDFQTNCMDVVRAANPDLVGEMSFLPTGDQQAAGQPSWINPIMIACDQTRLLDALGEIAGADLTNDTFRAALDELGPFDLYGYGLASFSSDDKWDGLDEFFVQEYDAETDRIEVLEPVVVDR